MTDDYDFSDTDPSVSRATVAIACLVAAAFIAAGAVAWNHFN